MNYTLTITNERIWNFYEKNKHISFTEMNLQFIDFFEKIYNNYTGSLSEKESSIILENVKQLQTDLVSVKETFSQQQNENLINLIMQFKDYKKEYTEELKMVLINNTTEKIAPLIEKSTDILQDKTKILINELREISFSNSLTQTNLHNNLTDLLRKLENSSSKGRISENILLNVLQNLYPIAQLDYVGTTKESGDIILIRKNKPVVLFENKNYDTNVGKSEIDKFYRDVVTQNCCGILLSQKTAIVNKENFEIEIYNGKILMFLHNVEYNPDKIRVAIDIIDHFNETLPLININNDNENIDINKDILNGINKEYQEFVLFKINHIKTIKESSQKIIDQVEEFRMPSLETILQKYYPQCLNSKTENSCHICQKYVAKTTKALAVHIRSCEKKNNPALQNNIIVNTV